MKLVACLISLALLTSALFGCAGQSYALHDGYYTSEAKAFDSYGWKEFVTIYVGKGRIVSVEYNAKNESGFIKSWNQNYMRVMNAIDGTYPNEYTRAYASSLLETQNPEEVDAISGATNSHNSFKMLAVAAIEQARNGVSDVAFIELPEYSEGAN